MNAAEKQIKAVANLIDCSKKFYKLSSKDRFGIPTRCIAVADYYGTYTHELNYQLGEVIEKTYFIMGVVSKELRST